MSPEILELAEIIWRFHVLGHEPVRADVILALGTNDTRVARHAADLYHRGFAPLIVCSGGLAHQDDLLATGWTKTEAAVYAEILQGAGVPAGQILLENAARNTAENFRLGRVVLEEAGIKPRNILVAVKPFMQRRAMATAVVEWPEVPVSVSSWPSTFEQYCMGEFPPEKILNIMMGDLQRIWIYAERGWSAPQRIPEEVMSAYDRLRSLGFTHHLLPSGIR